MINPDIINIYKAKNKDYYGSVIWNSMFRLKLDGNKKIDLYRLQQILSFKRNYINSTHFKKVIDAVIDYFKPNTVIALPSSSLQINSIQKLLNNDIVKRIKEVKQEKYKEKKVISDFEAETLEIDYKRIKGRVILIDDMITTGTTMEFFKRLIMQNTNSTDFIFYGLGISHKLDPLLFKEIKTYKDDLDIDIEDMLKNLNINTEVGEFTSV